MIWLSRNPDLPLVTYRDIVNEIHMGRIMHLLGGHLIYWVDPSWQPPYKTSSEAIHGFYEYEDMIRNEYLGPAAYTDNKAQDDKIDEERVKTGRMFTAA